MERKGRKNELADPQLPAIRSIADGRAMPACQAPVPERLEKPEGYNCRGLFNGKGNPDGFLSHDPSLRDFRPGRFLTV